MSSHMAIPALVQPVKVNLFSKIVANIKNHARTSHSKRLSKLRPLRLPAEVAKKEAAKKAKLEKPNVWQRVKKVPETIKEKLSKKRPVKVDDVAEVETPSPVIAVDEALKQFQVSSSLFKDDDYEYQDDDEDDDEPLLETEPLPILNSTAGWDLSATWKTKITEHAYPTIETVQIPTSPLCAVIEQWGEWNEGTDSEVSSIDSEELLTPEGSPILGCNELPCVPVKAGVVECEDTPYGQDVPESRMPAARVVRELEYRQASPTITYAPRFMPKSTTVNISWAYGCKFSVDAAPLVRKSTNVVEVGCEALKRTTRGTRKGKENAPGGPVLALSQ
ncbi:unnamed protein product [Somion occarium]|uniref:Uncharacterized protein n=1 Tax=Somion occarium TaxID=3059160 RepID=A0ABP1EAC8_9APHY